MGRIDNFHVGECRRVALKAFAPRLFDETGDLFEWSKDCGFVTLENGRRPVILPDGCVGPGAVDLTRTELDEAYALFLQRNPNHPAEKTFLHALACDLLDALVLADLVIKRSTSDGWSLVSAVETFERETLIKRAAEILNVPTITEIEES